MAFRRGKRKDIYRLPDFTPDETALQEQFNRVTMEEGATDTGPGPGRSDTSSPGSERTDRSDGRSG